MLNLIFVAVAFTGFLRNELDDLTGNDGILLEEAPSKCDDKGGWTVSCSAGPGGAETLPLTCSVQLTPEACDQCGISDGESRTSDELRSCAASLATKDCGTDSNSTPASVALCALQVCQSVHELEHVKDFSSDPGISKCESEKHAFDETTNCLNRFKQIYRDLSRNDIVAALGALAKGSDAGSKFNQCICQGKSPSICYGSCLSALGNQPGGKESCGQFKAAYSDPFRWHKNPGQQNPATTSANPQNFD